MASAVTIYDLRGASLMAPFSDEQLDELAAHSFVVALSRGELLFEEGTGSAHFYIVRSGRIRIARRSPEGAELGLSVVESGGTIGDLSVMDGLARSATAESIDEAEVIAVPADRIRSLLTSSPEALMSVVEELASIVRRLTGTQSDLIFLDLPRRLAKLLLTYIPEWRHDANQVVVELPMSQAGIAAQLGVARQSLNTALRTLTRDGRITVDGRRVTLTDVAALRNYVGA
ncbi:Crp/Fnr family transcriptional regulator [Agreia pratensis]|uniref:Crp/Fnr family transcriptional regulator n=1 Tax=Agreia pratensis TaxID=150121 RepID=UPI00188C4DB5|nr:Crp/Fnr family transcriptional regulator [Agreia pratensis]MBF4635104.1 Crp/Fnr family transcriptional regulator [Agreia pratensis]